MIEQLVKQFLDGDVQKSLGKTVDAKPEEVSKLTELAIPTLLAGLGKNSSTDEGANSLLEALSQHENQDLSNLENALKNIDAKDGSKIIGHIFGADTKKVEDKLAKESGLNNNQVSGLLNQLAPLLMGTLGQEKKAGSLDAGSLSQVLLSLVGSGSKSGVLDIVLDIFTSDGDNVLADLVGNLFSKQEDKKSEKSTKDSSNKLLDSVLKLLK